MYTFPIAGQIVNVYKFSGTHFIFMEDSTPKRTHFGPFAPNFAPYWPHFAPYWGAQVPSPLSLLRLWWFMLLFIFLFWNTSVKNSAWTNIRSRIWLLSILVSRPPFSRQLHNFSATCLGLSKRSPKFVGPLPCNGNVETALLNLLTVELESDKL